MPALLDSCWSMAIWRDRNGPLGAFRYWEYRTDTLRSLPIPSNLSIEGNAMSSQISLPGPGVCSGLLGKLFRVRPDEARTTEAMRVRASVAGQLGSPVGAGISGRPLSSVMT